MNIKLLTSIRFKFMAVLLLCVVFGLFLVYQTTVGRPRFCASCHMMKPEYFTQQASSHAKLSCVACHIPPTTTGLKDGVTAIAKNIYRMATKTYLSPIKLANPVSDAACERCHQLNDRTVNKTLDVAIPHGIHKSSSIRCAQCHNGIAHGYIDDKKVTYETDYPKWDASLAESFMSNTKALRPTMDSCMRCHQLRKITLGCKSCHPSGKLPISHKVANFVNVVHGQNAKRDLKICDYCHGSSSTEAVNIFKPEETYKQYLGASEPIKMEEHVTEYSRQNTFCRNCHSKLPQSHKTGEFIETHGAVAKKDQELCMTCHDNQGTTGPGGVRLSPKSDKAVTETSCSQCHPSVHYNNLQWKKGYHPVALPSPRRIIKSCYTCHSEEVCGGCHGKLK